MNELTRRRHASGFAVLKEAEVVVVTQAPAVLKFNALLGGLIVVVAFVFARTWPNDFGKEACVGIISAFVLAFLFSFETVSIAFATSIMESVASTITLVVVPFGDKTVARPSVFGRFANGCSKTECVNNCIFG